MGTTAKPRITAVISALALVAGLLTVSAASVVPARATPGPLQCDVSPSDSYSLPGGVVEVVDSVTVDKTWAGHYVMQSLLTSGSEQYVAYYNTSRQMTVAHRTLPSQEWTYEILPTTIGWDSHNSVTMAVDRDGHLHVSGNMHNVPLVYFRTEVAGDVNSLVRIPTMVDSQTERAVTYPTFRTTSEGDLLFRFRSGVSGDGMDVYYKYDESTRAWSSFLSTPLLDGEGLRNAYPDDQGPVLGPDGNYHMVWVWRDSGTAESSNTPSYARSADLLHWENSKGEPIELPITYSNGDVIEAVGPGRGIINNNIRVGFDADGSPVVSYHRYDDEGNSQIWLARPSDTGWDVSQVTDWVGQWSFAGTGTLNFDVSVFAPRTLDNGDIEVRVSCLGDNRSIIVDSNNLEQIAELDTPQLPYGVAEVQSQFPGVLVNTSTDLAQPDESRILRWESLPSNRDLARPEPWPEAQDLTVITLRRSEAAASLVASTDGVHHPGDVVPVNVVITNISDQPISGSLSLEAPSAWGVSAPGLEVTLEPGASTTLTGTVSVPGDLSGDQTVMLAATFGGATGLGTTRLSLSVVSPVSVEASVPDGPYHPGDTVRVAVDVTNRSDQAVNGRVGIMPPAGWPEPPASTEVTLAPGASETLTASVTIPSDLLRDGPATLDVTFGSSAATLGSAQITLPASLLTPPLEAFDHVDLGDEDSESAHGLTASATSGTNTEAGLTRRYTRTTPNAYFQFTVNKPAGESFALHVRETYGASLLREYNVLVNGTLVNTSSVRWDGGIGTPSYVIPITEPSLWEGDTATVRFQMNEHGRNSDPSIADVWVVPYPGAVEPTPELDLDVIVASRCVAGRNQLTVTATNTDDVPLSVTMESGFGSRVFSSVAPGRNAFHGFTTRLAELPGGEVTVTADGIVDGERRTISQTVGYDQQSCG